MLDTLRALSERLMFDKSVPCKQKKKNFFLNCTYLQPLSSKVRIDVTQIFVFLAGPVQITQVVNF